MAADAFYHSVSQIVRKLLINGGVGFTPASVAPYTDWSAYYDTMPDDRAPVKALGVFDTEPMEDGRYMETGDFIDHYGVEILVRGKDSPSASRKVREVLAFLSGVYNADVVLPEDGAGTPPNHTYRVIAFDKTSGPVPLGQDEKDKAFRYSLNGTFSIEEIVET